MNFHPKPLKVDFTHEATAAIDSLNRRTEREYDHAEDVGDEAARAAWSRTCEHAAKLSLIYACSENHLEPQIGLSAFEWASEFALHQTRRQLYLASIHVAENPFHAECLKFKKRLHEQAYQTMPRREMMRVLKNKAADFDQIVSTLLQQGEITTVCIESKTKPAQGYRLLATE